MIGIADLEFCNDYLTCTWRGEAMHVYQIVSATIHCCAAVGHAIHHGLTERQRDVICATHASAGFPLRMQSS